MGQWEREDRQAKQGLRPALDGGYLAR